MNRDDRSEIPESFVHLHVHSHYSLMWGTSSPEVLCKAAAGSGCSHLALTDTNGFYGLMHFLTAARRHRIRPLVGAHLQTPTESAVILARTVQGYELLADLISSRHLREDFSLARYFPEAQEHLAVLSDDPELLKALRSRAQCWVEAAPGPAGRRALQTARSLQLPPVASNRVYFAHPEDHPLHRLLRAIDCNRTLSTLPAQEVVDPEQWLQPPAQMADHFPGCPEALANTGKLARQCHTEWDHFRTVFPHYADRQRGPLRAAPETLPGRHPLALRSEQWSHREPSQRGTGAHPGQGLCGLFSGRRRHRQAPSHPLRARQRRCQSGELSAGNHPCRSHSPPAFLRPLFKPAT